MTTGPFRVYEPGLLALADRSVDFVGSSAVKAALLVNGYTVDLVNHDFFDDVAANECADGDYAQVVLSGKSITRVANKIRYDCADVDFGNAVTISARYCVIYLDTGTPGTSPLLFVSDLNTGGGNLSSTASDFDVAINANGIYEITPNV